MSRKTYARHKGAREQSQFSAEFQQFLQDNDSSTQMYASIPTTTIPLTSAPNVPLISSEDLAIDVSMLSLDDGKDGEEDEGRNDSPHGEVEDLSMYFGDKKNAEVRSTPRFFTKY